MKKIFFAGFVLALLIALPAQIFAATANPNSQGILVDEKSRVVPVYEIDGYNYIMLRDAANAINFGSVEWNEEKRAIEILSTGTFDGAGVSSGYFANTETATVSSQKIYIDGVENNRLTAYMINGNNFFKLRDLGEALDFAVVYDEGTKLISIYTNFKYNPNNVKGDSKLYPTENTGQNPGVAGTGASGEFTDEIITLSFNDPASKEDYSQQANPEIFNYITRDMYNAARQTYLDRVKIDMGNTGADADGIINPLTDGLNQKYRYAHYAVEDKEADALFGRVLIIMSNHYIFGKGWPGTSPEDRDIFRVVMTNKNTSADIIAPKVTPILEAAEKQENEKEKLRYLFDWTRNKLDYGSSDPGLTSIFNAEGKVTSLCSGYERAFSYLAGAAGFPVISLTGISVNGEAHVWNEVYFEGQWLTVDATGQSSYRNFLTDDYTFAANDYKIQYDIAKEILVPGSTK